MASCQDGAPVDVQVNPNNPSEATQNPRRDGRMDYVLWTIAGIFAALALFVATRLIQAASSSIADSDGRIVLKADSGGA